MGRRVTSLLARLDRALAPPPGRTARDTPVRRKARIALHRLLAGPRLYEVDVKGAGLRMRLPWRFVTRYAASRYEPLTTDRFLARLRPGATVVDVGAHVGYFALLAGRRVGAEGSVIAFEPGPENVRLLRDNAHLNRLGNVAVIEKAVGATSGLRRFTQAESSDSGSFFAHPLSPARGVVEVLCTTLDAELADRHVDVVKIDVEGAELEVLRGMEGLLAANAPIALFVELNPSCLASAGVTATDVLSWLEARGFSLRLLDDRSGEMRPIGRGSPLPTGEGWYGMIECVR